MSTHYRYTNPALDYPMTAAFVEMDAEKRKADLSTAMNTLMEDLGLIPVLFGMTHSAGRKGRVVCKANPMSRSNVFYATRDQASAWRGGRGLAAAL